MSRENQFTRRQMLKFAGITAGIGAGAMLAGCNGSNEGESGGETPSGPVVLRVYDPSGHTRVTQAFAPRLDSLEGKKIAFIADDLWETDRTFSVIKELLEKMIPGIVIYTQDQFPHGTQTLNAANNGVAEMLVELGIDGAIIGNAG